MGYYFTVKCNIILTVLLALLATIQGYCFTGKCNHIFNALLASLAIRFRVTIFQVNVQGQGPSLPFPSPSCPPWGRNKPGQCNLQMVSTCDCPTDQTWCDHDGECPGSMLSIETDIIDMA